MEKLQQSHKKIKHLTHTVCMNTFSHLQAFYINKLPGSSRASMKKKTIQKGWRLISF